MNGNLKRLALNCQKVLCEIEHRGSIGKSFLRLELAGLLIAGLLLAPASGCVSSPEAELTRYEFAQPQMGAPFRVVLYARNQSIAESAASAVFQRVAALNLKLSDYETDSELNVLSRTSGQGKVVPVSEDLWNVLEWAQQLAGRSQGAFDVTVGPVVSLWRKARREKRLPDAERLAEALNAVGYRNLLLKRNSRTAELLLPGMKLDLGGIAKGYAVDEALEVLRGHGVTRALVAASGDIGVGEPPPHKSGWQIEVVFLDVTNAGPSRTVVLANAAISSSGDLYQRLEIDGKRYSHIVDPRTGIGLTNHTLVTVIARDSTTADALATAVSVLGPEAGQKLVEAIPGSSARIVRELNGRLELSESARFRRNFPEKNGRRQGGLDMPGRKPPARTMN